MEEETNTLEVNYDSGSDESDTEEVSNKVGTRDSNALLDTWLAELDSLTTVRIHILKILRSMQMYYCLKINTKVFLLFDSL